MTSFESRIKIKSCTSEQSKILDKSDCLAVIHDGQPRKIAVNHIGDGTWEVRLIPLIGESPIGMADGAAVAILNELFEASTHNGAIDQNNE